VRVGDFVLAIGYPANIGQSVTSGIVSGLHRSENFIQTDAAIYKCARPHNPGNAVERLSKLGLYVWP
jgi:serine protease DegQ